MTTRPGVFLCLVAAFSAARERSSFPGMDSAISYTSANQVSFLLRKLINRLLNKGRAPVRPFLPL